MKPASKKNAAAESVAPPNEVGVVHQDENIQQRCAIGDVQSMKGMLDDIARWSAAYTYPIAAVI